MKMYISYVWLQSTYNLHRNNQLIIFFLEIIIKATESQPGLHNLWQSGSRAVRKWRENEKMKRKWRENEEMERKWKENEEMKRDSPSTFPHFLFISSLSIH